MSGSGENRDEPRPVDDPLLAGAWALDALDDADRAAYEERLRTRPGERAEAEQLRETACRLGAAEQVRPPGRLRSSILAAIADVPQEAARPDVADLTARRERGRRPSRWSVLVAAAGIVVALVGAGVGIAGQRSASTARQEQTAAGEVAGMLTAPGAQVSTVPAAAGGTATVVHAGDRVAVTTSGLPTPQRGRVYQLWLVDGTRFSSAGLLTLSTEGGSSTVLHVGTVSGVGITVEPAGGSRQPTTPPVVLAPLTT